MSRSGGGAEGSSGGPSGSSGTASQQADNITRNMILGLPKEGLDPQSPEAADLRAAEAFVSDIQQEIMAYDIANAKAMETYMRTWWSKVPFFGRHAKAALEAEQAAEAAEAAAMVAAKESGASTSALDGLDAATAAAAASAAGGVYLHTHSRTLKGGGKVERTSALSEESLRELAAKDPKAPTAGKASPASLKTNTWLFKRNHPGWVPLMQRWWVPWVCVVCIGLVWTPDVWKLRTLYVLDHQYALLRQNIHIAYWQLTMKPDDFEELMKSMRTGAPSRVTGTDCPF